MIFTLRKTLEKIRPIFLLGKKANRIFGAYYTFAECIIELQMENVCESLINFFGDNQKISLNNDKVGAIIIELKKLNEKVIQFNTELKHKEYPLVPLASYAQHLMCAALEEDVDLLSKEITDSACEEVKDIIHSIIILEMLLENVQYSNVLWDINTIQKKN